MPRIRFRVDNDSPAQSHSTVQHVVELQTGSNAASASPAISDTLMSDTHSSFDPPSIAPSFNDMTGAHTPETEKPTKTLGPDAVLLGFRNAEALFKSWIYSIVPCQRCLGLTWRVLMFLKVHDMFDFPNCLLLPLCRYRLWGYRPKLYPQGSHLQYTVVWSSFLGAMPSPKPANPGSHTAIMQRGPQHYAASHLTTAPSSLEHRRGAGHKIKINKKDPADKTMARMTHVTSDFGMRAIPLLRSFFRALKSCLADGYFCLCRARPDNNPRQPQHWLIEVLAPPTASAASAPPRMFGKAGYRVSTCPSMKSTTHRPR